jgi:hypothetical protein
MARNKASATNLLLFIPRLQSARSPLYGPGGKENADDVEMRLGIGSEPPWEVVPGPMTKRRTRANTAKTPLPLLARFMEGMLD